MSIEIIKQSSYANTTAYNGRPIKYIVIHYTAGASSKTGSARGTALMFSNPAFGGSADFIVDDAEIVQFNPDINNYYCWHAGVDYSNGRAPFWGRCTNSNSIGIEVCSTNPNYSKNDQANSPKWSFTDAAIEKAVELVKYLMQKYNIPVSNVIRHWDVCYKACPGIIGWNTYNGNNEAKWLDFKSRLTGAALTNTTTKTGNTLFNDTKTIYRVQIGAFKNKDNADEQLKKIKAKGFNDSFVTKIDKLYKVQVGAFTAKTNAENYKTKVKKAGFKDCFIVTSSTAKKSVTEIAKEVIAGKWGVGNDRKTALETAGYNYNEVQTEVNRLMR